MGESDFFYKVSNSAEEFSAQNFRQVIISNRWDLADILRQKGYAFADRTIKASIPLKASKDFVKLCRIKIEESNLNERICEIAKKSFTEDVRFFDSLPPKMNETLLEDYLSKMQACYVCRLKGEIIGFIEVVEMPDKISAVIRLAAVDEKYRLSGGALSLYAGAANLFQGKNFRKLEGRISCKNLSVLNLYASLGATFSASLDVYIRSQ